MTAAPASMPRDEAAALLDVPIDAPAADVQRAYLRAARRTHPDLVPETDVAGRRAAGAAFAELTRARDALLAARPMDPLDRAAWSRPAVGDVRSVPRATRNLGGSLVVLALLGFLMMGLVAAESVYESWPLDTPVSTTTP